MTMPSRHPSTASNASTALAKRLFALASGDARGDAALLAASEHMWTSMSDRLSRWFGPYGSLALMTRALHGAQPAHDSLSCVSIATSPNTRSPVVAGFPECARTYGAMAAGEGAVAMAATLTDLIGRLIGDDLAAILLEQSSTHQSPADANGDPPASDVVPPTLKEP